VKNPTNRPPTNLRALPSSFVGRAADVAAIAQRVEEERLVTILGPGGIGKTRLALRFAEERVAAYAAHRGGGVWFCDLTDARDASAVAAIVAATLDLDLDLAVDPREFGLSARVGEGLARRGRLLLVLDSFERVVLHAEETVGLWLRLAPSARFLVTSRVALDLMGEQLWSLSPLTRDDAIELFARRARRVRPSFDASKEAEAVASIVDAIDRIPLAIELAASRVALLSTSQLHERLTAPRGENKRGDVLGGRRDVGRHASMRRTVLDSVALLDAGARRLFAGCSIMQNGFTLDAVEAVLGGEVLEDLSALVQHSLLRAEIGAGDVARYSFFELIRDVAEELAAAEVLPGAVDRFVAFYAEQAARSPVAGDLENYHQAYARALGASPPDARSALTIALGIETLLSARGQIGVLARMLDDAMRALETAGDPPSIEAHLARGISRRELGQSSAAREDFERALAIARQRGRSDLAAVALTRLGGMSDVAGDTRSARARLDEALALLAETPPGALRARREAEAYLLLGHARRREGALPEARVAVQLAIERYRELGHDEGLAAAMYELGVVAMFGGAHDEAFACFDEGLRVAERGDVRVMTGALKTARGCVLQELGRLDEALEHHAEAARVFRDAGTRHREASSLYYLASTYLERDEPRETVAILRRARATLEGVGAKRYEVLIDGCLASAHAASGELAAAEEALARAERAAMDVADEPALVANVKLHRLTLELRAGKRSEVPRLLRDAEALVAASPNDDSRFALRVLRHASGMAPRAKAASALVVSPGGASFRTPEGAEVVELPNRSPLRRILEHLAVKRIEAPGEVVTIETIIGVGWPGERIASDAALNRAYVALASLRKMGLRGLLVHGAGGYALAQSVVVRIESLG